MKKILIALASALLVLASMTAFGEGALTGKPWEGSDNATSTSSNQIMVSIAAEGRLGDSSSAVRGCTPSCFLLIPKGTALKTLSVSTMDAWLPAGANLSASQKQALVMQIKEQISHLDSSKYDPNADETKAPMSVRILVDN